MGALHRLRRVGATAALIAMATACSSGHDIASTTTTTTAGSSCAAPGLMAPSGCWAQVLPLGSGGFPASPGSGDRPLWAPGKFPLTLTPRVAFDDALWMTAQTLTYSSTDGLAWTEHAKTDWGERIYHAVVFFHGKLWMFGGLDYATNTFLNDIWASTDGTAWQQVATAAWPARGAQTMLVYHDRLWLFGGANHLAADRSTDGFRNDVWVSEDAVAWNEVTGAAPWSPRDYPGVTVFNNALYLVGGHGHTDVWRSSNGNDWTLVTTAADWPARDGNALVVFDDKLWVFGGFAGPSTNALNDVWYTSDGARWDRQAEHAPWGPRDPVTTIVFHNQIWIYSGKHTGATDNWGGDLWQMNATTTPAQ